MQHSLYQLKIGSDVIAVGPLEQCQIAQMALSKLATINDLHLVRDESGNHCGTLWVYDAQRVSVSHADKCPVEPDDLLDAEDELRAAYRERTGQPAFDML